MEPRSPTPSDDPPRERGRFAAGLLGAAGGVTAIVFAVIVLLAVAAVLLA